jgi:transcriptional regulator with XRE-family HTH domain
MLVDPTVLGERIRQAREQIGLSQEEFAVAVSRDQGAISEYENGKRKLPATDLPLFARVLGVPVSYFYEGEQTVDDLDQLLLAEFQQLPTRDAKRIALQILRLFSDGLKLRTP